MAETIRTMFQMAPGERHRLDESGCQYLAKNLDVKILSASIEALFTVAGRCAVKGRAS